MDMMMYGASQVLNGLLLIVSLGYCNPGLHLKYGLWMARRAAGVAG